MFSHFIHRQSVDCILIYPVVHATSTLFTQEMNLEAIGFEASKYLAFTAVPNLNPGSLFIAKYV